MLVQRRRRWANIRQASGQRLVFADCVNITRNIAHCGNIATDGSRKSGLCPTLIK